MWLVSSVSNNISITFRSFTLGDEQYSVGDFVLIANDQNGRENLESHDSAFAAKIKDIVEKGNILFILFVYHYIWYMYYANTLVSPIKANNFLYDIQKTFPQISQKQEFNNKKIDILYKLYWATMCNVMNNIHHNIYAEDHIKTINFTSLMSRNNMVPHIRYYWCCFEVLRWSLTVL